VDSRQPTSVISSLPHPQCRFSSNRRRHAAALCYTFFSLSQDELATSASSSGNTSFHRIPSQAKIEVSNPHHRHRSPSPDRPTLILHCYKNIISTLVTLLTTQPHVHFASSLAKATCHQCSTRRCHSLSPPSHIHYPFTQ
jgi:hypothetical protein